MRASETPIEIDTPAAVPIAIATLTAPANAPIAEVSVAWSATLPTVMPVEAVPSPSMNALTLVAIRFSAKTPAPLKPTPAIPPAPIATEPATTRAAIACDETASAVSAPLAEIDEFLTYAWISAAFGAICFHFDVSV